MLGFGPLSDQPLSSVAAGATSGAIAYSLTCDAGSFTIAGQDATLRRGYSLNCEAGAFVISGQDATLRRGYSLTCDAGAFVLAGQDATLVYTPGAGAIAYALECEAGAFVISGQDASLVYTPDNVETWGGWSYYQVYKKEWEEIPASVVKVIEKIAKTDKRGDQLEIALRKEIEEFRGEYLEALQALKAAHVTTLRLLKKQEERKQREIQDEDDSEVLLLLT